jgi:hypothetical protein
MEVAKNSGVWNRVAHARKLIMEILECKCNFLRFSSPVIYKAYEWDKRSDTSQG